jgi:carbamoyl-phosphate synthase large subunit
VRSPHAEATIRKVLIIGSGPIIIGQACEFDYSGTQACKALRKLGYEIVLVNSNPATIMTDPVMADATYIEPLNVATIAEIIAAEKPDALLPNLGGQTGLNLSSELAQAGVLAEHGVKIIGVSEEAIERGEDRLAFKETMDRLGIEMPRSTTVTTVEAAEEIAADLGYPVVIRPAYTMGGTGGGLVYNVEELRTVAARGIQASRVNQILVEESVLGWEELEVEVVRDVDGKMISVCFIENVDPMGVHTGDSLLHRADAHHLLRAAGAARALRARHRRGDRGHRRHQRPVGARPGHRARGHHRDQPAHVALLGARLQGDRAPHRLRELAARRRADARRDPVLA